MIADLIFVLKDFAWRILPRKLINILNTFYFNSRKNKKQKFLLLHVFAASKCNLNCKSCSTFAPVASDSLLDICEYENDCKRLSFLGHDKIPEIHILGGEPLLHPNIVEILRISRKYFPLAKLKIVTNGILLKKQTDEFWNTCKNCSVEIIISHYPIKIDIEKIMKISNEYGVSIRYYKGKLPWFKIPLDLQGKNDINKNYKKCQAALQCVSLFNGKISTCQLIYNIRFFREYFNKEINSVEGDYIDIYKADSMDEILEFIGKPVPFCRFCTLEWLPVEWRISKKEMKEWV